MAILELTHEIGTRSTISKSKEFCGTIGGSVRSECSHMINRVPCTPCSRGRLILIRYRQKKLAQRPKISWTLLQVLGSVIVIVHKAFSKAQDSFI
jgi:hypothetical protein